MHIVLNLDIGGSENCVVNMTKETDKDQFNVSVCCLEHKGVLAENIEKLGIPVYSLNKGVKFNFQTIKKLSNLFKENKIDVIHTHHLGPLIYGFPAALIVGIKNIIHSEHSYIYLANNKKLFFIAKYLFKNVNKVVGVCADVTNFIKNKMKINPSKAIIIHNGIDIDQYSKYDELQNNNKRDELGIEANSFVVGTVGRLDPIKNHKGLLNAFKTVLAIIPHAKLVIVGDGELKKELETLSGELKLNDSIKFLGMRKDIPEILKIMDVFVLPSFSEGLSIALLEAMASKKPIIASNVDGNKNILQNNINSILINPNKIEEITDAIINLSKDEKRRQELIKKSYNLVKEKYSLSTMTDAYQEHYKKGLK